MTTLTEAPDRPAEAPDNPYVGPEPLDARQTLHGRDPEVLELLDLLIAERIVLLYSPSGAGKTSLIQAALIPRLRAQRFNVLPLIRVGRPPGPMLVPLPAGSSPPDGLTGSGAASPTAGDEARPALNRFVISTLLSLGGSLSEELSRGLPGGVNLSAYLESQPRPPGARNADVLIFDQFEEVLTIDLLDRGQKEAFFRQIGTLLENPRRFALFAVREDYLAALDPYRAFIPTSLRTAFRLDLLDEEAAREAIVLPAREAAQPRRFAEAAVRTLVDDLRRVQVQQPDGTVESRLGPYVEPVELQVVCQRLWSELPPDVQEITETDVAARGDVTEALRSYYSARVGRAAETTGVSERALRSWIDCSLITPQGIRSQVLRGSAASRELPAEAVQQLIDAHLVRAEDRGNRTWYELAHDRLVQPVRADNAAWLERNLSSLQRAAARWHDNEHSPGLLLHDQDLVSAEQWAAAHPGEVGEVEGEFLTESRRAQATADRERRYIRALKWWTFVATTIGAIALIACLVALWFFRSAVHQTEIATSRGLAAAALNKLDQDPELSVLLALQAVKGRTDEAVDALHRAVQASKAQLRLAGERGAVAAARFSRAGRVATANADGSITLWDAASGQQLNVIPAHAAAVAGVAFSPDGRLLASASSDGTARLWQLDSGELVRSFRQAQQKQEAITDIAFSPDGRLVAASVVNATVQVWDVASSGPPRVLGGANGHKGPVTGVAFGKDANQLGSVGDDRTARVWDLASAGPPRVFTYTAELNGVAFSPGGARLAVAARDRSAAIWGLGGSNETPRRLQGHADWVYGVAFSPDGTRLATAGRDGRIKVWNSSSLVELQTLSGHTERVNSVEWAPDGHRLISASSDGSARIWDTSLPGEVATMTGHGDWVASVAYSPDGSRVASASSDGTLRVWDATTGQQLFRATNPAPNPVDRSLQSVAYSPDGTRLATTGRDGRPRIWDASSGSLLLELPGHCTADSGCAESNQVAFSPDGKRLASASRDWTAAVWDIASGRPVLPRLEHESWVYSVAFSPDGARLATASWDKTARVWDASSGRLMLTLEHQSEVNDVAFSVDGTHLATGTLDGNAHLWDLSRPREERTLVGHADRVYSLAFSPEGARLATASWDHTAKVWDVFSGAELASFYHADDVYDVAFAPTRDHLATAGSERLVQVYTLDVGELTELASQRVTRRLTDAECQRYLGRSPCP
ncbi:MAG: hypothetical protein IT307_19915 [Chloroflexi bacterium]|nr:hypothetical protein [Chloroflexota bacterium]